MVKVGVGIIVAMTKSGVAENNGRGTGIIPGIIENGCLVIKREDTIGRVEKLSSHTTKNTMIKTIPRPIPSTKNIPFITFVLPRRFLYI